MNNRLIKTLVVACTVAGMAAPLAAQKPAVGDKAPTIDVKEAFNGGPGAWQELEGKAVLVKFTASW